VPGRVGAGAGVALGVETAWGFCGVDGELSWACDWLSSRSAKLMMPMCAMHALPPPAPGWIERTVHVEWALGIRRALKKIQREYRQEADETLVCNL